MSRPPDGVIRPVCVMCGAPLPHDRQMVCSGLCERQWLLRQRDDGGVRRYPYGRSPLEDLRVDQDANPIQRRQYTERRCQVCLNLFPRDELDNSSGRWMCMACREADWAGRQSQEYQRARTEVARQLGPGGALESMIARLQDADRRRRSHPIEQRSGYFDAPDWDLFSCLEHNPQDFGHDDIDAVLASRVQPREQRGWQRWHWVLRLLDGDYAYLRGECRVQWDDYSMALSRRADTPYDCLPDDLNEYTSRELIRQLVSGLLASTRRRIGESILHQRGKHHTVYQAMGFEINHTWLCENCGFVSLEDMPAREHSELSLEVEGPKRLRRSRSGDRTAAEDKPTEPKRRLRGPRADL